jgi:type II secretory pathway component PulF
MITLQDLYNIVGNKITNEMGKTIIRNNFPPHIAEQMCTAIDAQERVGNFQRFLKEYNDWMQQQQTVVQQFLREYYH